MYLQIAQVQYNAMEEQAAQQRKMEELGMVHAQASNDARALQLLLRWAKGALSFTACAGLPALQNAICGLSGHFCMADFAAASHKLLVSMTLHSEDSDLKALHICCSYWPVPWLLIECFLQLA